MGPECRRAVRWMEKHIDSTTDAAADGQLRDHLLECPECRDALAAVEAREGLLRVSLAPVEPPEGFARSVMERVRSLEGAVPEAPPARGLWERLSGGVRQRRPLVGSLAAVAAAGLLFLGVQMLGGPESVTYPHGEPGEPAAVGEPSVPHGPGIQGITDPAGPGEPDGAEPPAGEPDDPSGTGAELEIAEADPGTGEETAAEPVRREIVAVDTSGQARLDETITIASQQALLPAGKLTLETLYASADAQAVAPSYTDGAAGILFYRRGSGEGSFSLVRMDRAGEEITVVARDVDTDARAIARDESLARTTGLRQEEGVVTYRDRAITPELPDTQTFFALAPNNVHVAISARSGIVEIQGLWITDIYTADRFKLTDTGGGRILGWSGDSRWVVFTDSSGDVYAGNIQTRQTYLAAYRGDAGGTAKIAWHPDGRRLLLGARVEGTDGIYEAVLPR